MSLLCTGAVRGFGKVTPVVSDTAETSIAEGGAIVPGRVRSVYMVVKFMSIGSKITIYLFCFAIVAMSICVG